MTTQAHRAAQVIDALDERRPCPLCGELVPPASFQMIVRLVKCHLCAGGYRWLAESAKIFEFPDSDWNIWTYDS